MQIDHHHARWAAPLACLAIAAAPAAAAPPEPTLEQVQALVQPSVVYMDITWTAYVYDRHNDQYFSDSPFIASYQCTGFVVNPDGYIGTAGHCVDYSARVRAEIFSQVVDFAHDTGYYAAEPSKRMIASFARHWRIDGEVDRGRADQSVQVAYGVSVSGEPVGKALPARVISVRPEDEGDVGLVKIDATNLTTLPLSDNADTGVGTEVVAVGYPAAVDLVTDDSFDPSFKEGSISAEKTTQGGLLPVYEISAPVSQGMSGGPTSDLQGNVIGVNSFTAAASSQPFNFVQPAQNLQELMRAEGVPNDLGTVTEQYRTGVAAYYDGDREAAIASFDAVLQTVPSHQFAQEYRQKSEALPKTGGSGAWLLAAGVLVLLLVAVGVVIALVLRRRRTTTPAPAPVAGTQTVVEPAPTEVDRFCPGCGAQHEANDLFCPHCGHKLR